MDSSAVVHKRIYQACDNCRTKRVRCNLGSVDQPTDPPCARCKRENKECIFSTSRKKRAKVNHDHTRNAQRDVEVEMLNVDISRQYDNSPPSGDGNQTESPDGLQTVSALLDRQAYTSNDALEVLHEAFQHGGNPAMNTPGSVFTNQSRNEADKDDAALKIWNSLRFVRTGLFTAGEALSYVNWFYDHLVPFSPVPSLRFKDPLQHMKLIEEEPVLALTILTLASRYMKLGGPGAVTRSNVIHDRLWNHLRGMITRVFWSEENLMTEDATAPVTEQRSVLRTVGTCEALLLLLEWHPKMLHFPAVDNDTNSIAVRDDGEKSTRITTETRYGRMRSGVDWLSRSDRMCWSLLGLAQTLAVELGLSEKQDIMKSQEDIKRAHRIQNLLWVFSIQTSGRLGWKYFATPPTTRQTALTSLDDTTSCWVSIASLSKKAHELLFATPKQTNDLVSKREYGPLLRILQALLEDWEREFETANLSKSMRWILAVEYEFARVYIYSIVLPAVVESRSKENNSLSDRVVRGESQREDTDVLYDGLYLRYLTDAARSLLRVVVDDIFPQGVLYCVPVRTYSRILAAAVYLLKTCAIESKSREAQKSLDLVVRTAKALQSSVVDDVHLGPHWGELLVSLCSSLSSRHTIRPGPGIAHQAPLNNQAPRNQPTPQNSFDSRRKSSFSSNNSPNDIPPFSAANGNLSSSYDPVYVHDLGIMESSLNSNTSFGYENMFSWADPMGGMDITQMPWNGDQAIFDILASAVDSENQ